MNPWMKFVGLSLVLAGTAFAAKPDFGLSGTIGKDHRTEVVSFSFKVGAKDLHYRVEGNTEPRAGIYQSDSNLSALEIFKRAKGAEDEMLETRGTIQVYPRKRKMNDVVVAGVPLKGLFIQGAFNDGLFLDELEVDGRQSRGLIDYSVFTGYYMAKRGLRFGDVDIASSLSGTLRISNHDNVIGQNRTTFSMLFGDLKVTGLVYYSDTTQTHTDSDGDSTTSVVATLGRYNLQITKKDGSPVKLAAAGESETADDVLVRKFIAYMVVFGYDMVSE